MFLLTDGQFFNVLFLPLLADFQAVVCLKLTLNRYESTPLLNFIYLFNLNTLFVDDQRTGIKLATNTRQITR